MKPLFLLHIIVLFFSAEVFSQVQSDSLAAGKLDLSQADTVKIPVVEDVSSSEPVKEAFRVYPWQIGIPFASSVVTTDSLQRWQVWPGFGAFQAYRDDVIAFRQGTAGAMDAFHINGYLPHEQKVKLESVRLNNPVTGLANFNLIPHRKIAVASEELKGKYESHFQLRDYYITKPVSYLNYDESDNSYRNLEFMITQNFTERTNVEISYWDRRDGNYYPNNEVKGSQIYGKIYHHLSEKLLLKSLFLRNTFDRNEPFGYIVDDPQLFSFDQYSARPVSSNGASEFTRLDWTTGIYHRKDSASVQNAGLEFSLSKNKKNIAFTADTVGWDIRSLNGRVFHKLDLRPLELHTEIEAVHHQNTGFTSLNIENWTNVNGKLNAGFTAGNFTLYSKNEYAYRSDSETGYESGIGLAGKTGKFHFDVNVFLFSRIPTIQSKYWASRNYYGNPTLRNEIGYSYTAKAEVQLFNHFNFGASWRYKNAKRQTFLHSDSTFYNSNVFQQYSATVFGKYETSLLEITSSATAQLFDYCCEDSSSFLNQIDRAVWIRNNAFIKGYVFDRAAYLKIGIKTLFSPLYYQSRTFNTELQYWQGNSSYLALPPFFRLDAELSARVRSIMVVLRWENALDGMGQAGYFETAGYPMPPRRLIVGIRAQFRN